MINTDEKMDLEGRKGLSGSSCLIEQMRQGRKTVIGMVHCQALPGTLHYHGDIERIIRLAVEDARELEAGGVDGICVENGNDSPTGERLEAAQIAALGVVAAKVREQVQIPIGIDAAFNDCRAAFAVAVASGAEFIRCPVFVDTVVSGAGVLEPCNREAVLYRRWLKAEHIGILADVQVKHAFLLAPQISIVDSAKWAQSRGADVLIITGKDTGEETSLNQVQEVKRAVKLPVIVGSGIKAENVKSQFKYADGAIVGTEFKRDGIYQNPVDRERVKTLMEEVRRSG